MTLQWRPSYGPGQQRSEGVLPNGDKVEYFLHEPWDRSQQPDMWKTFYYTTKPGESGRSSEMVYHPSEEHALQAINNHYQYGTPIESAPGAIEHVDPPLDHTDYGDYDDDDEGDGEDLDDEDPFNPEVADWNLDEERRNAQSGPHQLSLERPLVDEDYAEQWEDSDESNEGDPEMSHELHPSGSGAIQRLHDIASQWGYEPHEYDGSKRLDKGEEGTRYFQIGSPQEGGIAGFAELRPHKVPTQQYRPPEDAYPQMNPAKLSWYRTASHSQANISLYPRSMDAEQMAIPGGLPPEQIRLELVNLGDSNAGDLPNALAQLADVTSVLSAYVYGNANLHGASYIVNNDPDYSGSSTSQHDFNEISYVQHQVYSLASQLAGLPYQTQPWVPSMLVSEYATADDLQFTGEIIFVKLGLTWNGTTQFFPLAGSGW